MTEQQRSASASASRPTAAARVTLNPRTPDRAIARKATRPAELRILDRRARVLNESVGMTMVSPRFGGGITLFLLTN